MNRQGTPSVGFVSLGCPKALVDSERILTRLRAEGYQIAPDYAGADAVVVNTCGFIDAAVEESLDAIDEALAANGRVIVTGCLGAREGLVAERFPEVLRVTGPEAFEEVMAAVHDAVSPPTDPFTALVPPGGIKLTPRHYAYLKIAEGCNHKCTFCVIPRLRGRLVSRPMEEVLDEAAALVAAGVKELLVVSQDTSAYGVDTRHRPVLWRGEAYRSHVYDLARALATLGVWVRLHYVYPYPHVDEIVPLMAEGGIVPYLDVPLQHASPRILKLMRRPANAENTLERIRRWRDVCPGITVRSTFIVGFPGETEGEFRALLEFVEEAELDRLGCFGYSPVDGARANELPDPVPQAVAEERRHRLMEVQQRVSARRLAARRGQRLRVLVDRVERMTAHARSTADAPEIDGNVLVEDGQGLSPGDFVDVEITGADTHDLYARRHA